MPIRNQSLIRKLTAKHKDIHSFNSMNNPKTKIDISVLDLKGGTNELIGSIDEGTSSTRFLVFTKKGDIAAWSQMETQQIYPEGKIGWHEHDVMEIWNSVIITINAVLDILKDKKIKFVIKGIGITNQRETTVAWNATTGKPYSNAIVWDDTRTASIATTLADGNADRLRPKTGMPLTSYSAGTRVKWLCDNIPEIQKDLKTNPTHIRFGTIDTWLVYQLSGTPSSATNNDNYIVDGLFVTDVSNASRWLFADITTDVTNIHWDASCVDFICSPHKIPISTALPEIRSSSEIYGKVRSLDNELKDVPIAAILGDQQAALFGQTAFEPGEAKNTYGTGMFLMMNTGTKPVPSKHGLITTVGYQIGGPTADVVYALEGAVSHSGSTIQWLRDQLHLIKDATDTETYATERNDGLYFVPAFAGLFAPHWRSDARGCIVGMTATHHRGHVCRAALEQQAYQAKDIFDAIMKDSNVTLKALKVDGGGSRNKIMMQFQSDMINVPVIIPKIQETTAMGAAFAAGLAVGIWKDLNEIKCMWGTNETFQPRMSNEERSKNWSGWEKAITKSLGWVEAEEKEKEEIPSSSSVSKKENGNNLLLLVSSLIVGFGAGFLLGKKK